MKGVMKGVMKQAGPSARPLLAGLLLMLPTLFPVAADTLNFTVTATVVESSCSVNTEDLNQGVLMGDLDVAKLESTGMSDVTYFSIRLEKCNAAKATVKFSSNYSDGNGFFYPLGANDTWGYVLGFTKEDGSVWPLEVDMTTTLGSGANQQLTFGVTALRGSGPLRMGDFSALAMATISYQ
ncbi:fimbrial protein [Aeromonas veronii]|uniref:fimbrial protein n=1 Tax=Aeromonas veronii TaxID=654 RepID=UPI003BA0394C